jgi:hypothetical protein
VLRMMSPFPFIETRNFTGAELALVLNGWRFFAPTGFNTGGGRKSRWRKRVEVAEDSP